MAAKTDTKPTAAEIKADVEAALTALETADTLEKVDGLSDHIVDLLKGLRANQRVGLEMRRKEAVTKASERVKEATKAPSKAVAKPKASASWEDMEGGAAEARKLMDAGVERIRKGAEIGLKAADLFKEVANVIFEGRLRLLNKEGLPDITAKSDGAKQLSKDMFAKAKETVAEDQVDLLEFHASLAKGVSNRMQDVSVEFLRALSTTPMDEAAKSFPFLTDGTLDALVTAEGVEFPEGATPEDKVRWVYSMKGINLPSQTRAEVAKADRERKALEAKEAAKAAEEGTEEGEGEGSGEDAQHPHSPAEDKLVSTVDKMVKDAKRIGSQGKKADPEVKAAIKSKLDDLIRELALASAALS
ncbi:immunity repressor [Streptomyces phage Nesbitt]|uniref:Immunity repressor n=1 Tax=Streptomyces phage Nesbitt TaxID=2108133 RepID=A0A2P1JT24_9CAUD|nr:immunity repressor [Streptomyces phage Nesbitt]